MAQLVFSVQQHRHQFVVAGFEGRIGIDIDGVRHWRAYSLTSVVGDGTIFVILVALSGFMYWRAQQQKVDHNNVNADWDASTNSVVPADVRGAAAKSPESAGV